MKPKHLPKTIRPFAAAAVASVVLATLLPSSAAPILLEQFDYEGVDQALNGLDGGSGFDGPWVVNGWSRNYEIGRTNFAPGVVGSTVNDRGGLEFGDFPAAGSAVARFGTAGQREAHRMLSTASQSALTADGTTIWFSVLAGAPDNNKFGTLIFGSDPMVAVQGGTENGNLSADGQGFGITFTAEGGGGGSGSPNAVAFVDSTIKTIANGSYTPPITGSHHDTSLIVGKINWSANGTDDELFLFNMETPGLPEPSEATAIASLSADFDQSTWTLIALWDTGATIYDEIRFGTSFSDVTGGAAAPFKIVSIDYDAETASVALTWTSSEGEIYSAKYSPDMSDWSGEFDDGIPADAGETTTTRTFDLGALGLDTFEALFFRIERL